MQGNNFVISLIFDKVFGRLSVLRYLANFFAIMWYLSIFFAVLRFCGIQNPPMSPSKIVRQSEECFFRMIPIG